MSSFTPKELFSASGLNTAKDCARSWAFTYILGIREPGVEWCDIESIGPRPEFKVKSKPTDEEKRARKAWNKKYRPSLGKEVHARIEQYYAHALYPCVCLPVDWSDVPGRIALSGLSHLPAPAACSLIEVEADVTLDLAFMGAAYADDPIVFRGKRDLLVRTEDDYLLIDHKSTYTFDYIDRDKTIKTVKTPEQLQADGQANIYALNVMQTFRLEALACRWVYYRTEDGPAACAVDFTITREDAEAHVANLVEQAIVLREHMRKRTPPSEIPGNIESCAKYGGCVHHPDQGGTCVPPELTTGERLIQLRRKQIAAANKPKKSIADVARAGRGTQTRAAAVKRTPAKATPTPISKEAQDMALSFREKAEQKRKEAAAQAAGAATITGVVGTVVEDTKEEVFDNTPVEVEDEQSAAETDQVIENLAAEDEMQERANAAQAEYEADKASDAKVGLTGAPKPRKQKQNVGHIVPAGGLAASMSELVAALGANEAEHADILQRMRAALGAS